MKTAVVVPAYNESPTLEELISGIRSALEGKGAYRIFLVDDGSTDGTWAVTRKIADDCPALTAYRLRRNFGKTVALTVGFHDALAWNPDVVVTMDADLQDDPAELPRMLETLETSGVDVVCGWKRHRQDPLLKCWGSKIFNWWVSRLFHVEIHDVNTGFKAYRPEVLRKVTLHSDMHRLIPVYGAAIGYRVGEVEVKHHPRRCGRSKYGCTRIFRGIWDVIAARFLASYREAPGHFFGRITLWALGIAVLGMVPAGIMLSWISVLTGGDLSWVMLIAAAWLISCCGVMVLWTGVSAGLLAELVLSHAVPCDPEIYIAEKIDSPVAEKTD